MSNPTRAGQAVAIVIVILTLAATTSLVYLDEGTKSPAVQFYYVPILVAGFFLGEWPAILTGVLAAFLAGPHMPKDIPLGQEQAIEDIIIRTLFFFVIAYLSSRAAFELRRRAAEFRTLYEVAQTISSTLRVQQVLDLIARSALAVMDAKACTIRLLSEDGESLRLGASAGLSESYVRKGPVVLAQSELDRRVLEGGPVAVRNVQRDTAWQYRAEGKREGLTSVLSIPLRTGEENKGVIRIYAKHERSFTSGEMALLTAFANQAAIAIENAELYEDIRRNYYETVRALTLAIEAKDPSTRNHSERVTVLATELAERLRMSAEQIEQLRFGTILHDIGKIGVEEALLEAGDQHSEADEIFLRMHPLIGKSILDPIEFLRPSMPIVLYHHEHWDGSGYPEGLARDDIPYQARLVGIVNAYDELVSPLNGRGVSEVRAQQELLAQAGNKWDPDLVREFVTMLRERRDKLPGTLPREALPSG